MRTNIIIDDEIMERAMNLSGLKTKKAMVETALYEYVLTRSRKDLSDLKGKIRFADTYNYKTLRNDENDFS